MGILRVIKGQEEEKIVGIDNWSLSTSSDVDNWDHIDPHLIVLISYVT